MDHENLLLTFGCVVGKHGAVYVSGPITTGPRFVEWFLTTGYVSEEDPVAYKCGLQKAVIQPNEFDLVTTAESLRVNSPIPVIEPASLKIIAWNQKNYYQFWKSVIGRYVARVVVTDGWQFSVGCAIEFYYAIECGIPVETVNGKPVSAEHGGTRILDAAVELRQRCGASDKLQYIADRLTECATREKV
jgi:hypothetical protein